MNQTLISPSLLACNTVCLSRFRTDSFSQIKTMTDWIWYHSTSDKYNPLYQKWRVTFVDVLNYTSLYNWMFTILRTNNKTRDGQKERWYKKIQGIPSEFSINFSAILKSTFSRFRPSLAPSRLVLSRQFDELSPPSRGNSVSQMLLTRSVPGIGVRGLLWLDHN